MKPPNDRPQTASTRPPAIGYSAAKPGSSTEKVITSFNGIPIRDFVIPITPIERILKKSNGKFMNSYLLDKMLNQSRIDLSEFDDQFSEHTKGKQTGRTVNDRRLNAEPSGHSPTSEGPSTGSGDSGIEEDRCAKRNDQPANQRPPAVNQTPIEQQPANVNLYDSQCSDVDSSVSLRSMELTIHFWPRI